MQEVPVLFIYWEEAFPAARTNVADSGPAQLDADALGNVADWDRQRSRRQDFNTLFRGAWTWNEESVVFVVKRRFREDTVTSALLP